MDSNSATDRTTQETPAEIPIEQNQLSATPEPESDRQDDARSGPLIGTVVTAKRLQRLDLRFEFWLVEIILFCFWMGGWSVVAYGAGLYADWRAIHPDGQTLDVVYLDSDPENHLVYSILQAGVFLFPLCNSILLWFVGPSRSTKIRQYYNGVLDKLYLSKWQRWGIKLSAAMASFLCILTSFEFAHQSLVLTSSSIHITRGVSNDKRHTYSYTDVNAIYAYWYTERNVPSYLVYVIIFSDGYRWFSNKVDSYQAATFSNQIAQYSGKTITLIYHPILIPSSP